MWNCNVSPPIHGFIPLFLDWYSRNPSDSEFLVHGPTLANSAFYGTHLCLRSSVSPSCYCCPNSGIDGLSCIICKPSYNYIYLLLVSARCCAASSSCHSAFKLWALLDNSTKVFDASIVPAIFSGERSLNGRTNWETIISSSRIHTSSRSSLLDQNMPCGPRQCILPNFCSTSDIDGRWEASIAQHIRTISHNLSLISAGLEFPNIPSCP